MLSDLEKAYEYLESHNLIKAFMHNYETASNGFKSMQSDRHGSFIRRAFEWSSSHEGRTFWDRHDEAILRLHIRLSATDVLDYINSRHIIAVQPYEYW